MTEFNPKSLIKLLDYTSLNDTDTQNSITDFCAKAETQLGNVAAVCVYPQFVHLAKSILINSSIHIATVINFPSGHAPVFECRTAIKQAIDAGADEIDAVIPYQLFLEGNTSIIAEYVTAYRDACGTDALLKVILETGAYQNPEQISDASHKAIEAGADFIKTSTGKIAEGASLTAAGAILNVIKKCSLSITSKQKSIGLKISGGVSSIAQAESYYLLAAKIMGYDWISANTFRIGSSRLLPALLI